MSVIIIHLIPLSKDILLVRFRKHQVSSCLFETAVNVLMQARQKRRRRVDWPILTGSSSLSLRSSRKQ